MPSVDTIGVGAGVVGLAIGRAEAMAGRDVLMVEAAERCGTATSARNSEVLHAGIFHPPGWLKSRLRGRSLFRRPIYPPQRGGFSVHATIDLAGALKFGPDAEPVDRLDYAVDPARASRFAAAICAYWPNLPADSLQPGYAGIRPRLHAPGEAARDFGIEGPADHGVAGLVQLFGIESPGLTACLAIATHVGKLLNDAR